MILNLDLQLAYEASPVPSFEEFENWVRAALQHPALELELEEAELTIRLVDEEEGTELNETWRQKTGPTNVLSFPFDSPPEVDLPLLGDIVICVPVVEREAAQQQKANSAHFAHLVIHGVLHLLGYDHIEDAEAEQMEHYEIEILAGLGYPNPYC